MTIGKPGADSSVQVTPSLIKQAEALFKTTPMFWGRYFGGVTSKDLAEYRSVMESPLLRANNIRVAAIGQNTFKVGGSEEDGAKDAVDQIEDILVSFEPNKLAGGSFFVFLDVEAAPVLSADYYVGWATEVAKDRGNGVSFLPCLYTNYANDATWLALRDAKNLGAGCHGIWMAAWDGNGCLPLRNWADDLVPRHPKPFPADIIIWQYADDCGGGGGFDCNMINPNLVNANVLAHMILP